MKFGLFLNTQSPRDEPASSLFDGMVAQTRAARDGGFDLLTMGQHYLADYNQLQLIPTLSRLAAEAGSMTVATGIVLLPLHHPVEIAEQLTTLDVISSGAVAGVGAGYRDVEFASFGIPKQERAGRLTEGVELMKRLWSEENVTYRGTYYSVEDVTINPQPDEPLPVWIAANTRPAILRAAEIGDAWFVNPHATIAEISEQKRAYNEIRDERSADNRVPLFREAFVAPSTDEAMGTAQEYLEAKYKRYIEWGQDDAMEDDTDLHRSFDDLAQDRFVLGTPAEVCAEIERYEEDLDPSHLVFRMQWPGLPTDATIDCIELMADEVIPNV